MGVVVEVPIWMGCAARTPWKIRLGLECGDTGNHGKAWNRALQAEEIDSERGTHWCG